MTMRDVARAAFRFAAAIEPPRAPRKGRTRWPLDPRHLTRAGLLAARYGIELADTFRRGGDARVAFTELDNKVRAFHLFENVVPSLDLTRDALGPADAIPTAVSALGPEDAVWATEGLGYELAERRRQARRSLDGLLADGGGEVPSGSWTVLHTGMGMALAEARLERLRPRPTEVGSALDLHLSTCSQASRPGYVELAFEPLGLVGRILYPKLVGLIDDRLAQLGERWSDFFWHGVGRGLYFLPTNLPPNRSSPWAGVAMCLEEPPHERGRRNTLAGYAWAVTLVNLRRPVVLEHFLAHHANSTDGREAIIDGVSSSLQLWHEATGGSKTLRRLLGHVAAPEHRGLWREIVRAPFDQARKRCADGGHGDADKRLVELFRCDLPPSG